MVEKEKFLPFMAINEFMRDDYRLSVISEVLSRINEISVEKRNEINKLVSKYVTVQGFRNSSLASVGRKAKASVTLFERSNDYCCAVIDSWMYLHPDLAQKVFQVLSEKNWENLQPLEFDRSKLPGFQIHWPKSDHFQTLIDAAKEKGISADESEDNISLMAVWIGNRLPYDLFEDEEKKEE
jgi:hypothetical protein